MPRRTPKRIAEAAKAHEYRLRTVYGLTADEYQAIKEAQGGKCAICQRATGRTKRLSVDHDHKTGFVRGLLCSPCNTTLGRLRDDPDAFRRALGYLFNPPAFAVIGERAVPTQEAA